MRKLCQALTAGFILLVGASISEVAYTQSTSINFERLSSMEEPLTRKVGQTTLVMSGVVDSAFVYDAEDKKSAKNAGFLLNFQIDALTQLSNRWHVGLSYFGQYTGEDVFESKSNSEYLDNASFSVGSSWGRVSTGNVFGIVREETRRLRGAGNADLQFDDFLGGIDEQSTAYTCRFGPWVFGSVVDGDGRYDLGTIYQRPNGMRDYRITFRTSKGSFTDDSEREYDTKAAAVVAEVIYGSTLFDFGGGQERFESGDLKTERWYVSTGIRRKFGALNVSVEGHTGRVAGANEKSTALGAQYDMARGLSVNLGVNRAKVKADLEKKGFTAVESTKTSLSLRYSF